MYSILLVIIYISFISLGLPDALLGSAWPDIYKELQVPVSYAGMVSMIISTGTITSSLISSKLLSRFGTGVVTAFSVMLTAIALLGFGTSQSFIGLCLWAIPYGLGGGSVDAALNNFVALHYKSMHMSWLHCFWGIGATFGPYIMGYCLTSGFHWNSGYFIISALQIVLTAALFLSLPLWKKTTSSPRQKAESVPRHISIKDVLRLPGSISLLVVFFSYCAIEATAGLWASSYMVLAKGINVHLAAKWTALFYLGITIGRLISGFITLKLNNKNLIRLGQSFIVLGIGTLLLPLPDSFTLTGLLLIGLGCAPIFPSLLHATPENFGADISQSVMGIQMACAYLGSLLIPPVFGFIANHISITYYPVFLLVFLLLMIVLLERTYRKKIAS